MGLWNRFAKTPMNARRPMSSVFANTITSPGRVQSKTFFYLGRLRTFAWLARRVSDGGCDTDPKTTTLAEGIERRDYGNRTDRAEVSLVFFDDIGHGVPGYREPHAPKQADSPIDGYVLAWELLMDDSLAQ